MAMHQGQYFCGMHGLGRQMFRASGAYEYWQCCLPDAAHEKEEDRAF